MFRRKLYDKLIQHLPKKEFSIITGPRQTGKTTLLRQLEEYCRTEGIPTLMINLEDKSILSELVEHPLNLLKFLPASEKRTIVFIDEVQYHPDPSNFLKLLFDEHVGKIKIIATGSSAFYLDQRFKDSMAGRKRLFLLMTCSFDEYLSLSGKPELVPELERLENEKGAKSTNMEYLKNEWEKYLIFGGYPAVITEPERGEKIEKLNEIRDAFIRRDMQEAGVANDIAFYQLFRILASQTGKLLNTNELASTLRIKHETVQNYLSVLQKCFHIGLIKPFYKNIRKEIVKMPKVYLFDNGMRNALLNNFNSLQLRSDRGELWENYIFKILAEEHGTDLVYFWRTTGGNEVDFVLPFLQIPKAIEVKYDESAVKQAKYKIFRENYPDIQLEFKCMEPMEEYFFYKNKML
jgi:uncharacterized protein